MKRIMIRKTNDDDDDDDAEKKNHNLILCSFLNEAKTKN